MANASPPDGEGKGERKDSAGSGAHGGGAHGESKARARRKRNSLPRTEGVQTVPRASRRTEAARGATPGAARNHVGGLGPCVALLELASIAAGFETVDALRKEAAVEILRARPVSPGKFVILFTGTVEDTTSAYRRGLETGADVLIDSLLIPNIEPTLLTLIRGEELMPAPLEAVGIIETLSVASTIRAADIASKTASLRLIGLGLAVGIGGKSYVTFTGEVSDVTASVEAGAADAQRAGMLVRRVVIPSPHGDMAGVLGL
jgi:microcompartment protein CcmL/EutN